MPTVLITGGHGGIGLEACRNLASRYGANLVLAGRSMERMEPVARDLRTTYGVGVSALEMDTSSLPSVRSAAAKCRAMLDSGEIDPLQAIICNAGVRGPLSYSVDGFEQTFATNCLGHFLLVELLIDRVADHGRVVFTVSGTHDPDTMDGRMVGKAAEPDAVALAHNGKNGGEPLPDGVRYSTSKLCMVLYAYELDRRLRRSGSSIASIAFDPGSTSGTGFLRDMPGPVRWLNDTPFMNWVLKRVGVTMGSVGFSGAALARIAADPEFASGSGKYFQSNDGRLIEARSSKVSYDERRALKLWRDSEQLVHLQGKEEPALLR
jgi:NAD(P)-dependent dehydrogenase (short-subunit alcohol dehydrogenase family)